MTIMMRQKERQDEPESEMARGPYAGLSRRERQIMEILFQQGPTTAEQVRQSMADPPSYSAVRAMLRVLEEKGHVCHVQQGPRYLHMPIISSEKAQQSALKNVMTTFFNGSVEQVVAALLDLSSSELSASELDRLGRLIESAKKEGE